MTLEEEKKEIPKNEDRNNEYRREEQEVKNVEEKCELNDLLINTLAPTNLFKIWVKIDDKRVLAMIDSGTTFSFIKSSILNDLNTKVNKEKIIEVIGYGNSKIMTEGECEIDLVFDDLKLKTIVNQISDENCK